MARGPTPSIHRITLAIPPISARVWSRLVLHSARLGPLAAGAIIGAAAATGATATSISITEPPISETAGNTIRRIARAFATTIQMFSSASATATSRPVPPTGWISAAVTDSRSRDRIGLVREIAQEIVPATVQVIEVVTDKARGIVPRREAIVPKVAAIARPKAVVPRMPAQRVLALKRAVPRAAAAPRPRTAVVVAP